MLLALLKTFYKTDKIELKYFSYKTLVALPNAAFYFVVLRLPIMSNEKHIIFGLMSYTLCI